MGLGRLCVHGVMYIELGAGSLSFIYSLGCLLSSPGHIDEHFGREPDTITADQHRGFSIANSLTARLDNVSVSLPKP